MNAGREKFSALIVDDSELSRIICEEMLLNFNISSVLAESGEHALAAFAEHEFDIVFLDHLMPGMDGVELCRRIRIMKGYKLPIVVFTGNNVEEHIKEYVAAGMSGWLAKPIESESLAIMLSKLLDKIPRFEKKTALSEEAERRLLKTFVMQVNEKLPLMDDYIAQGRLKDYTIEVHSFKSSLINTGEKHLSEQARQLEQSAKNGDFDTVKSKNPAFAKAVRAFSQSIAGKLERHNIALERPNGDITELIERLKQAKAAMEDYETKAAAEIIRKLKQKNHKPHNQAIEKLDALFDAYAYDKIDKILFSLITALGD
jgi:CheY-like chemotaxis protein